MFKVNDFTKMSIINKQPINNAINKVNPALINNGGSEIKKEDLDYKKAKGMLRPASGEYIIEGVIFTITEGKVVYQGEYPVNEHFGTIYFDENGGLLLYNNGEYSEFIGSKLQKTMSKSYENRDQPAAETTDSIKTKQKKQNIKEKSVPLSSVDPQSLAAKEFGGGVSQIKAASSNENIDHLVKVRYPAHQTVFQRWGLYIVGSIIVVGGVYLYSKEEQPKNTKSIQQKAIEREKDDLEDTRKKNLINEQIQQLENRKEEIEQENDVQILERQNSAIPSGAS